MTNATGHARIAWSASPGSTLCSGSQCLSVLPRLRSQSRPNATPQRAVLHWKTAEIDTLHWQGKTWIPLSDCPQLLDSPRPLIRA